MAASEQVSADTLRDVLATFSEDELRELCADVGVAYELLPGVDVADRADALVTQFARRRRLPELIANAKRIRPRAAWGGTAGAMPEGTASSDRLLTAAPRDRRGGCLAGCALVAVVVLALAAVTVLLRFVLLPASRVASTTVPPAVTPTAVLTLTLLPTPVSSLVAGTPLPALVTPTPLPTTTPLPAPTDTPRAATQTPLPSPTPTMVLSPTPTPSPAFASTPTDTPTPERSPSPTRVVSDVVTPTSTPVGSRPALPTPTPTPTPVPAPVLWEPENGAVFSDRARLKFLWFRRLAANERAVVLIEASGRPPEFYWLWGERDVYEGGGAVHPLEDGYLYEINVTVKPVSPGPAYWRVTIVGEEGGELRQVSPWSEERLIYREG